MFNCNARVRGQWVSLIALMSTSLLEASTTISINARLELLKLLAEQPRLKIQVGADYSDIEAIVEADFIISYTCDVMPSAEETQKLCDAVRGGKKWFALHGTNSILRILEDGRVDSPRDNEPFMELMGSQFLSHPPIAPYEVEVSDPDHPLVKDIPTFTVDDELYLCVYHGGQHTLLHTQWSGTTEAFVDSEWSPTSLVPACTCVPTVMARSCTSRWVTAVASTTCSQ